jgi:glycosyltransferase involved in cell wall biosynthesis
MPQDPVKNDWIEISDPRALPAQPLVSVLMITYNHGPYLAQAIEGVIAQKTDLPIELIIGEDCSKDETRQIALDYQKKYPSLIRVIKSEQNVGMQRNFERILRVSKGEYIALCEGDDYWHHPHKLARQIAFLIDRPEHGAVHSDVDHLIYSIGRWRVRRSIKKSSGSVVPEGDVYQALLKEMFIHTCSLMIRTKALKAFIRSRFNRADYLVVDWPLMLFVAYHWKVGYIDESMATYRRTPMSAINSGPLATLRRVLNTKIIYEDFIDEYGSSESDDSSWQLAYAKTLYWAAYDSRDSQRFDEALALFRKNGPRLPNAFTVTLDRLSMAIRSIHDLRRFLCWTRSELHILAKYDALR